MIRLLVIIGIATIFIRPIFRFVYGCVRRMSTFFETEDDLPTKYQNKIDAERSFVNELGEQEKEIKQKQKTLNKFKKGM